MKMKHLKLLRCMSEEEGYQSAAALSLKMNVSLRSIKNYVSEINAVEPGLIQSSRRGYRIEEKDAYRLLEEARCGIPQTARERVDYMINRLVNDTGKSGISVYDLAEEIYVSDATIRADIPKVKARCRDYSLTLKTGGDCLILEGTEKNKRKILSSIMFEESCENFMDIGSIQAAFQNYDVSYIRDTIMEVLKKHHYFINDYSMMNLVLYVAVAVDRISNGCVYSLNNHKDFSAGGSCEYDMSLEIAEKLGGKFGIAYNDSEIYDLSLLLTSSATRMEYQTAGETALEPAIGVANFQLTNELLDVAKEFYGLDVTDPFCRTRFALHMNSLCLRATNNQYLYNPLARSIKGSCPLIYDCAVAVSEVFKKKTGFTIPEDEIAYIALHIGSAAVTGKSRAEKVRCILLFPQYYDLNQRMEEQLKADFHERMLIDNVVTDARNLDESADLILSTIPLGIYIPVPVLNISPFLTNRDREAVGRKLTEIEQKKKAELFKAKLKSLLRPDFFEKDSNYQDRGEVLNHICARLCREGMVRESFAAEVLERERLSSTAFNNIAVPHSVKMNSLKTCLYIMINEKGIRWGEQTVNIVLLIAVNPDDRSVFREIFDGLTTVLTDKARVCHVLSASTWEDFADRVSEQM